MMDEPTVEEMLLVVLQRLEAHELLFERLIAKGVLTAADRVMVTAAVEARHAARTALVRTTPS